MQEDKELEAKQDNCIHKDFKDGKCIECEWKCDHDDIEEWHCLICGEAIEGDAPRSEPEYWSDR